MGKKIIVFTTFRDFNGGINDKIQRFFLQSVRNQNYHNFSLAVTVFKEKGVREALDESGLPYSIYNNPTDEYKFSWSQTLLNAIAESAKYPDGCILLWANSDSVLEPNYLERVAHTTGSKVGGISYPHLGYKSIEDYKMNKPAGRGWYGFDGAFFTSDVFTPECITAIKKYMFNDYGYFEFFIAALCSIFCLKQINLWPQGYVAIANDYVAVNQTYDNWKKIGKINMEKLKTFADEYGIKHHHWYYLLLNYKITSNSPGALLMRARIYIQEHYAESYLRRVMPRIMRILKIK